MVSVRLEGIEKTFEGFRLSVKELEVRDGEFLVLLGPSGCGKTTTLRIIAGLERPDSGRVLFDEKDVTDLEPYRRGIGFVFQDHALFPHMTVYENVAFGLTAQRLPRDEIERRVKWALELVNLRGLEKRYPEELSGGQRQRVAIARAMVIEPNLLLLDEPLSNLDAKIRQHLRSEIRRIQRELGTTTIYVTHDQEEAMAISDRIAVMNVGRIEQVGDPLELYYKPKSEFVARFLGSGYIGEAKFRNGRGELCGLELKGDVEGKFIILIRPENVLIKPGKDYEVVFYELLPGRIRLMIDVNGCRIPAERPLSDVLNWGGIPERVDVEILEFTVIRRLRG